MKVSADRLFRLKIPNFVIWVLGIHIFLPKSMQKSKREIMIAPLNICLVHYPIRDKRDHAVATAITNLDIHDIARSAVTFGVNHYFVVTPVKAQRWLARRILSHWTEGWGASYNPNRKEALSLVQVMPDLGTVDDFLCERHGTPPYWIATSARLYPNTLSFEQLACRMKSDPTQPVCLILGTGWGLHPELLLDADSILEPIRGVGNYNHLSVRGAAAIMLHHLTQLLYKKEQVHLSENSVETS